MPGKPTAPLGPSPLLSRAATELLGTLAEGKAVFEFGSGGSTLFLAQRAALVVSVEHDADWYAAVLKGLTTCGLSADVRIVEAKRLPGAIAHEGLFDVVVVDCLKPKRERAIALGAVHVAPGGWLVADDYDMASVKRAVVRLQKAGWDVAVLSGSKTHALRGVLVPSVTAFCHKGAECS